MVGVQAVCGKITMTLESGQFSCRWSARIFAATVSNFVIKVSNIYENFRLNTKQDWVIHDLTGGQEVCVSSYDRVHILDVLPW